MQKRRLLSRLGPQWQCVVSEVVVKVDQTGEYERAANVNDRRSLGCRWGRAGTLVSP